jgi:hypothetical protein
MITKFLRLVAMIAAIAATAFAGGASVAVF